MIQSSPPSKPQMSNSKPQNPTLSPSEFSHNLTKLAVAQILRSTGFKSSKSSALETLTRIAALFLQSLTSTAASHAAFSCNRTHCNVFDVVHALEQSSLSFGFPGASDVNQPLLRSYTLIDLRRFVDAVDEAPFSRRVIRRVTNFEPLVIFSGNIDLHSGNSRTPEIPRWLPEFPAVGTDDGGAKTEGREILWEERERRFEYRPTTAAKVVKGKKQLILQGRRERVKFKLGGRRRNDKVGGLDDLELRNGVCRGGKRVCLIKRVDDKKSRFFHEDDDDEKGFSN